MTKRLDIREFSDPSCPFGYSWEVYRRQIEWLFGHEIDSTLTQIGLHSDPNALDRIGPPEMMTGYWRKLADEHGMPFSYSVERHIATVPACTAIVAARINGANDRLFMRWMRIKRFSGELIDEPQVISDAARMSGIDPDELHKWLADPATEQAASEDFAAARNPSAEGHALDRRLASWDDGRRYSPPSWEITRVADKLTITAPGAQPFEVYEVAICNLISDVEQRKPATDPGEVLQWAGEPLATREIARCMGVEDDVVTDALKSSDATEIALESSSFWML